MLRIRLTRTGKKHQPTYRLVVAEHSAPIKGKFIEVLGYYLPTRTPKVLEVKSERILHWIDKGAVASDTVHNLLVGKGILTHKRDIKYARVKVVAEAATPKPATTHEMPSENSQTDQPAISTEETVAENQIETVKESTKTPVTDDTVIPTTA